MAADPLLELRDIRKSFGSVVAVNNASFNLVQGEIHVLAGENGAGKSTLVNIIAGIVRPDSGEILLRGKRVEMQGPLDAMRHGIAFVHQEIAMCPDVSVMENIMMPRINAESGFWMNYKGTRKKAVEALHLLADIDPDMETRKLSISQQQLVEITRALTQECDILILDEPTAALTQNETDTLFHIMNQLKAKGIGIIYISHRMSEIFAHCDRITVLRDGTYISTDRISDVTPDDVIRKLIGAEVGALYPPKARKNDSGSEEIMSVRGLSDGDRVRDVSFSVQRGRIHGLSGLIGSGRTETLECIAGLRPTRAGETLVGGESFHPRKYRDAINKGIVYLSENRKSDGVFLDLPIMQNIPAMDLLAVSRFAGQFLSQRKETELANELGKVLNLKRASITDDVSNLSGGNQQKVAIAKLLAVVPKILLLDEPTRGIDISAKSEIHHLLRRLADEGIGVVVVSSEISEITGICDDVTVLSEGSSAGTLKDAGVTEEAIIQLAAVSVKKNASLAKADAL